MANSMTLDGVDRAGRTISLWWKKRLCKSTEGSGKSGPTCHGRRRCEPGSSFDARTGVVSGVVKAADYTDLLAQRENINQACFKTQEGPKVVTFDAFPGKQFRAQVINVIYSNETPTTVDPAITLCAAARPRRRARRRSQRYRLRGVPRRYDTGRNTDHGLGADA